MPIIEVKNLVKHYETSRRLSGFQAALCNLFVPEKITVEAVKGINFTLQEGEIVGFLGPNGSGKTTTLKILSGILYPTAGEARVLGHVPWQREPIFQKQFAIVMGQRNQLWWDLPAIDTFLLNKAIYEIPAAEYEANLQELIEVLDMADIINVPVRKLSLGQRMKCEIGAALLHQPKVLFLDEPTLGLDVVSQQSIREFLKKYNREKKTTILLTSHYMEDVVTLCTRVIIINPGLILYDGDLNDLQRRYAEHKILEITFTKPVSRSEMEKLGEVREWNEQRTVIWVKRDEVKQIASRILLEWPVDDILINETEVEDIVRKIFAEQSVRV